MANDAAIEGVEIKDYLTGTPLGAAGLESLGRAANQYLRTGGVGTVGELAAQSVPDAYVGGLAQHTGAAVSMWPAYLCAPVITTAHTDLRVRFRVTVTGAGNGSVLLTTIGGGDALALGSAAAGPVDLEGLITIDTSGDYDELTCELATDAATTITVHGFWIWYEPVATPIPDGTNFSGAQAFGIGAMGADKPYDAMKTDAKVTLAEHARDRPRPFWSWVAIASAVNGDGKMLDRLYRSWVTLHRGAQVAGVTYRMRICVDSQPGMVYLLTGNPQNWPNTERPIAVAANGWFDATFDWPSGRVADGVPFPSTALGIWPWDGAASNPGRTTVDVLSLTIWGV